MRNETVNYKYVVEQPAVETLLDPNNPIRYVYIEYVDIDVLNI